MAVLHRRSTFLLAVFAALGLGSRGLSQSTYTWNGATAGAWYTTGNWTGGPAGTYPGTSGAAGAGNAGDVALFAAGNASATVGIDGGVGAALQLGAIDFRATTSLSIGNSSAAATAGTIRLNGATVNAVANTLVFINNNGSGDLTLANVGPGGNAGNTLGIVLGNTNGIFNIFGDGTTQASGGSNTRSLTIGGVVSEFSALSGFTLQGGGNLTLNGANTFTGNIAITSGRLQVGNASALGTTVGTTTVNSGGTLHFTAAQTNNENIAFAGTGYVNAASNFGALRSGNVAVTLGGNLMMSGNSLIFVEGNTTSVTNAIGQSAASNLSLAGVGTLALNGANTYSGTTTISQGTLNLTGAAGALAAGSGAITVQEGGLLQLTNSAAANSGDRIPAVGVTLNRGRINYSHSAGAANYSETTGTLTVTGGHLNTVTASQAAAGQTSLLTFGSMTRTANGSVNFAGTGLGADTRNRIIFTTAPTVTNGMIANAFATYNVTATTADFATHGANGIAAMGNVNTNTNGTGWAANQNLKFTFGGTGTTLGTGAAFTVTVNSVTMIQNGNTPSPTEIIDTTGLDLTIGSGGFIYTATGIGAGPIIMTGGTALRASAGVPLNFILPTSTTQVDIRIPLQGNGGLNKVGDGNLIVSNIGNLTGAVNISGSSGNGLTITNSDPIDFGAITIRAGTTNGGLGSVFSVPGLLAAIPATTSFTMEGFMTGGAVSNLTFQNPTGIDTRSALVSGGSNTFAGTVTLNGNGYIHLRQNGAGNTLTMNGNFGGAGFTGALVASGAGNVDINGVITLPNATLASGDITNAAAVTTTIVNLPAAGVNTISGLSIYEGSMRLRGSNVFPATMTVTLGRNGSATYQGQFWLNGFNQTVSYLSIASGSTAAATGQIVQNGAAGNSVLTFAGGATPSTFAGVIQNGAGGGNLGLTQTAGSLTLSGTNTYTGVTTLNGGTLTVSTLANGGTTSSIGSATNASANIVFGGGTLAYTGGTVASDRGFTLNAGTNTINVSNPAANLTFSGIAAGAGGFVKDGTGTMILTGANTYTGVTTINNGTLSVPTVSNGGAAGPLGSAAVASANLVFNNNAVLSYTGATSSTTRGFTVNATGGTINVSTTATNLTFSGVAAGAGSLTKTGTGNLILTGSNTYSGSTFVNAGVLTVNNVAGNGTGGATTVLSNAGTTLKGTGRLGGGLTVNAGSILAPGNSIGTLNNNAGTTLWNGGGTYTVEYDHSGGSLTSGTTIDYYNSLGTLDLTTTTSGNPFIINLDYIGAGAPIASAPVSIRIATFSGGVTAFASNKFTVTGEFTAIGSPAITLSGNDVVLNFTPVPEPATVLGLGALGLAGAGWARRRFFRAA